MPNSQTYHTSLYPGFLLSNRLSSIQEANKLMKLIENAFVSWG